MGLRIRTNLSSMTARRQLGLTTSRMQHAMEQMASGRRINRASDDAAGLAISEMLRSDVRALGQAKRNAHDAVSMLQVAEGSVAQVTNIVVRLRELAVQAASDTISDRERQYLDLEFSELKSEIDRIGLATEFNGMRLVVGKHPVPSELTNGSAPPFEIQVDKNYFPGIDGRLQPKPLNVIRVDLSKINVMTSGAGSLELDSEEAVTRVSDKESAQQAISTLDLATQKISSFRSRIGALHNRLEHATQNLSIKIESLSAARSRIVDVDFASVTADYTQENILQQSGAAVLAQANQIPALALKLLQG